MAPAGGEAKARKSVGMATCAASLFDASSCSPYMVDVPLALVFDRADMLDGQVVGCLQAADVAIAVDVQLPWVQLPAGSFVRFPKMRKGRIKLRGESWMMTEHPEYGQLLTAQNADEVQELFSENAFQKPPMVKMAPEQQQQQQKQKQKRQQQEERQTEPTQESPAQQRPQVLQQQQQPQPQVQQQRQQSTAQEQQSTVQQKPPGPQHQVQPQAREGAPQLPAQVPQQQLQPAQQRQEPSPQRRPEPSPARQRQEPSAQQQQQRQEPPAQQQQQQQEPPAQQQQQEHQQQPPLASKAQAVPPEEAPVVAAAAAAAAAERPAAAAGRPAFTVVEAREMQLELLDKYSTVQFALSCKELDESWSVSCSQIEKIRAVDGLCETAMRPVVLRYGFEASADGCAKAKAVVNEIAKIHMDVRERKLAIQRQIFSLFQRLQPKADLGKRKAEPRREPKVEHSKVEHKLMPRLEPKAEVQYESRVPVAFWGICDLKFDPKLPREDSVRVLELGDGRASRFSGCGSCIKEDFERRYCLSENPLKRAIMVDNKKVTHDIFEREGFNWLRPRTAFYPRRYSQDLAQRLVSDLGLEDGEAAVLKLVNRSRGAGVVVVSAENADKVLHELLTPPVKLSSWLEERRATAVWQQPQEMLQEACLHWWSNECPVFVAERCCHSGLVSMEGSEQVFDGTLRVAFALLEDGLQVEWLGGYWKLPRVACDEGNGAESPEQLHERIVSSFNSAEKRTAPVLQEHLDRVYRLLQPALPPVFQNGGLVPEVIDRMYSSQPLFRSFMLARSAAAIRLSDMARARQMLESARKLLPVPASTAVPSELPERSALAYIERNLGVSCAIEGRWEEAGVYWRRAVRICASNATAHYLEGCYLQVIGDCELGVRSMQQSIALDPDFRSSYVGLSNCYLLSGDFQRAMEACEACLRRFPDALAAQFNLAQAVYQMLWRNLSALDSVEERLRESARVYEAAKVQAPDLWTKEDENVLAWFLEKDAEVRTRIPREAVHIWRVFGWRP